MIEFTVTPTFADYAAANRLVINRLWSWPRLLKSGVVMAVLIIAMLAIVETDRGSDLAEKWPGILAFGIVGPVLWIGLRYGLCLLQAGRSIRKGYDQLGTVSLPTTYHFTDNGMQAEYDEGGSRHGWNRFVDFLVNDRVLLLRRTDVMFFLIPVEQVDRGQFDELLKLLSRVGVKRG